MVGRSKVREFGHSIKTLRTLSDPPSFVFSHTSENTYIIHPFARLSARRHDHESTTIPPPQPPERASRELRDQIIEYIINAPYGMEKIASQQDAARMNPLLLVYHQFQAETLQRVTSLRLTPVLEIAPKNTSEYAVVWTTPLCPTGRSGTVCTLVDVNFRDPQPSNIGSEATQRYNDVKSGGRILKTSITSILRHIWNAGFRTVKELHVNLLDTRDSAKYFEVVLRDYKTFGCSSLNELRDGAQDGRDCQCIEIVLWRQGRAVARRQMVRRPESLGIGVRWSARG